MSIVEKYPDKAKYLIKLLIDKDIPKDTIMGMCAFMENEFQLNSIIKWIKQNPTASQQEMENEFCINILNQTE